MRLGENFYLITFVRHLLCRHRNGGTFIQLNQGWKTVRLRCYDCKREFNRKCSVVHETGYDDDAELCRSCGYWYDASLGPCPDCAGARKGMREIAEGRTVTYEV